MKFVVLVMVLFHVGMALSGGFKNLFSRKDNIALAQTKLDGVFNSHGTSFVNTGVTVILSVVGVYQFIYYAVTVSVTDHVQILTLAVIGFFNFIFTAREVKKQIKVKRVLKPVFTTYLGYIIAVGYGAMVILELFNIGG